MPCPLEVVPGTPGEMTVQVTRGDNVNKVVMRTEDLDRETGDVEVDEFRTHELEEGVTLEARLDHSYNLIVGAVRKSADEEGSIHVSVHIDGVTLVDTDRSADGNNPTGEWTIVV